MLCLDIINTMLVSMPRPSRKLRTSLWERPKVSILRTITCNRYESQRHDIVAPSETAPSCSARCGFRCTTSSSPAASRWCFPGKIKQLREIVVRRMQHNLYNSVCLTLNKLFQYLSPLLVCVGHPFTLESPAHWSIHLQFCATLKLTCTRQLSPHQVQGLPCRTPPPRSRAPRSTSTSQAAPLLGCTLHNKKGASSPPEESQYRQLIVHHDTL